MNFRIVSEKLVQTNDKYAADYCAGSFTAPTNNVDCEDIHRPLQSEHAIWLDGAELVGLQSAGCSHNKAGRGKGQKLNAKRTHAHLRRRILVFAHGTEDDREAGSRAERHANGSKRKQRNPVGIEGGS